jgi:hypothetical protein
MLTDWEISVSASQQAEGVHLQAIDYPHQGLSRLFSQEQQHVEVQRNLIFSNIWRNEVCHPSLTTVFCVHKNRSDGVVNGKWIAENPLKSVLLIVIVCLPYNLQPSLEVRQQEEACTHAHYLSPIFFQY